ncbi:MAG: hypothetical protein LBB23_05005 [Rickettsiales bacterium]|jgi:hypothetical protein|nr:hypothetical protein [Rickettsiales bacterium]
MVKGSNYPVRLRFATARQALAGNFIRRDPGVKPRDDLLSTTPRLRRTPSPAKGTLCDCNYSIIDLKISAGNVPPVILLVGV